MNNAIKSKAFLWTYRIFGYFIPLGLSLWFFLIEKMLDSNISIVQKIGISGIFVIVVSLLIGIYFYKKHFTQKIENLNKENSELTDKILLETDETNKATLLENKQIIRNKLNKTEKAREIFNNILFVAPFAFCYIVCVLIEKEMISLRGFFLMIITSMLAGLCFNILAQHYKYKTDKIKKIKPKKEKPKKAVKILENAELQDVKQSSILMGE